MKKPPQKVAYLSRNFSHTAYILPNSPNGRIHVQNVVYRATVYRTGRADKRGKEFGFWLLLLGCIYPLLSPFDRNFINDVKMLMRNASVETQNRQKISFVGCCVASWREIFLWNFSLLFFMKLKFSFSEKAQKCAQSSWWFWHLPSKRQNHEDDSLNIMTFS